jgi:hypothetical protein
MLLTLTEEEGDELSKEKNAAHNFVLALMASHSLRHCACTLKLRHLTKWTDTK